MRCEFLQCPFIVQSVLLGPMLEGLLRGLNTQTSTAPLRNSPTGRLGIFNSSLHRGHARPSRNSPTGKVGGIFNSSLHRGTCTAPNSPTGEGSGYLTPAYVGEMPGPPVIPQPGSLGIFNSSDRPAQLFRDFPTCREKSKSRWSPSSCRLELG